MGKHLHEIRDPVHVFIRLDSDEREVLDSRPLQRLRSIHQLGLTYLLYPGATHRRFEHSLGVMELATRIFDVITDQNNIRPDVQDIVPTGDQKMYWRRVLRMAALFHDVGHLPFSHSADHRLFPNGWTHEHMTTEIIQNKEMQKIWGKITPPLRGEDIAKIAAGPKEGSKVGLGQFKLWETILSEIIVGDTFGADRMDYLLRDSLHAGVAYGKFDHYRLVDTLRILPKGGSEEDSKEPTLGLLVGGIQSAEALLWARYFMYSQVYCHPVRRIYDIHLGDFLEKKMGKNKVPTESNDFLRLDDNQVLVWIWEAASSPNDHISELAKRIFERRHFKLIYERNPKDQNINTQATEAIYKAVCKKFGEDSVRYDPCRQEGGSKLFPVQLKDGSVLQSIELSATLNEVPIVSTEYVFIEDKCRNEAEAWLGKKRSEILKSRKEAEE